MTTIATNINAFFMTPPQFGPAEAGHYVTTTVFPN